MDATLPTLRAIIWFVLVADGVGDPDRVVERVKILVTAFRGKPLHHVTSFKTPKTSSNKTFWPPHPWTRPEAGDAVDVERRRAAYATHFAATLDKMSQSDAGLADGLPPPHQRMSAMIDPDVMIPACYRANLDILGHAARKKFDARSTTILLDIGQSADRRKIWTAGLVPTLTTSSRIVAVDSSATYADAWMTPLEMMSVHGFSSRHLNMSAMTWTDGLTLVGESKALPALAMVMIPCLAELGMVGEVEHCDD